MIKAEVTVLDLANELKRLATGVVRDAKRDADLSCVSNLTAIHSLTGVFLDVMSKGIVVTVNAPEPQTPREFPVGFSAEGAIRREHPGHQ